MIYILQNKNKRVKIYKNEKTMVRTRYIYEVLVRELGKGEIPIRIVYILSPYGFLDEKIK